MSEEAKLPLDAPELATPTPTALWEDAPQLTPMLDTRQKLLFEMAPSAGIPRARSQHIPPTRAPRWEWHLRPCCSPLCGGTRMAYSVPQHATGCRTTATKDRILCARPGG